MILQTGGTDLNNHCCQPEQLARDILHLARQLILHEGVTKVATCQLSHRYPPADQRSRSRAALCHPLRRGYNELLDNANAESRRILSLFRRIHFWNHLGKLFNPPLPHIISDADFSLYYLLFVIVYDNSFASFQQRQADVISRQLPFQLSSIF